MRAWLLFLPIFLFAQSSSPPSKSVPINNAVPTAKGTKDSAPTKSQGAPKTPPAPSAAPTQIGPYKAQQPSQSSPANKPPEVTPDPIVRYTFWLVVVGILQFAALVIQAFFLYKAFRETITATGLTAQALVEAQRSNAANEKLTLESNANARDATEATRQSLILTHRPKLIVRNVVVRQPPSMSFMAGGGVNNGTPITGQFYVANIGGTPARIVEHFSMLGRGTLPMDRPYETLDGSPSDFQLCQENLCQYLSQLTWVSFSMGAKAEFRLLALGAGILWAGFNTEMMLATSGARPSAGGGTR